VPGCFSEQKEIENGALNERTKGKREE